MVERTWLIDMRGDLTHENVAEIAGIGRSTYTNVERGKGLSVSVAKKIAKALNFNWEIFFEEQCFDMNQFSNFSLSEVGHAN